VQQIEEKIKRVKKKQMAKMVIIGGVYVKQDFFPQVY
jgi:dihydrofolate reductase